jgi:SAM-dependent methyltransferase/uncharacterized protein YbaR (Trm112 family)
MSNQSAFLCLRCRAAALVSESERLICPACRTSYPLAQGVPMLWPSPQEEASVLQGEDHHVSLRRLQGLYDRLYQHEGLMGTELDTTYDRATKAMLLSFGEPLHGKRLLDVGAGAGNLWEYVAADVECYALDLSAAGLSRAMARRSGLTTSVPMAEYLPYPDSFFDVVVAADTIEHTLSPERALREIHRVLKPGGIFSASLPVPDSLRKWGRNELLQERPNLGFVWRLAFVVIKRTLLFGRPDFQPVDRDYRIEEWTRLIELIGLKLERVISWPDPPKAPIVVLLRAVRE